MGKHPCWRFLPRSMLTHKLTIHQLPSSPTCSHILRKHDSTNAHTVVSCGCSRYTGVGTSVPGSQPVLASSASSSPSSPFPLYCFKKQPGVSEEHVTGTEAASWGLSRLTADDPAGSCVEDALKFQESISWRNLRSRVPKPFGASLEREAQLFVGSTAGDSEAVCTYHPSHSPPRDDMISPASEAT